MKSKIKQIIENNTTKSGRLFDLFIQFLIILSLVSFSIETLPNLKSQTRSILKIIEIIIVIIFTIEYLLRIIVADKKIRFIFSFYGLIDLLAILPFYLSTGIDLRAIRVFRLLRLFRAFKIIRYSEAIKRFQLAFISINEELMLFFFSAVFLIFFASVGIYYFENPIQPEAFSSVFDSMWGAVATLTTVGYGDIYPITVGGKIFTFIILMVGLGIIAVPTGLIASALGKINNNQY
jgi:voltage-gated potassium channel